jgi:hypothetical protein
MDGGVRAELGDERNRKQVASGASSETAEMPCGRIDWQPTLK